MKTGAAEGEAIPISRRAKRGFLWSQIGGTADYGLFLVFSVIVARSLGAEAFGLYAAVIGYASLGIMGASLGMDRAIQVFVAPMQEEREGRGKAVFLVRRFFTIRFLAGLVFAVLMFFLALPLLTTVGDPRVGALLRWMGPYVIGMGLSSLFLAYFTARMELKQSRLTKAFVQLLGVLGAYGIHLAGYGPAAVLVLITCVSLLTAAAFAFLGRELFRESPRPFPLQPVRAFCTSQTPMEVLSFILGKNADIILLKLILVGTIEVAYYNVAAAFTLAISSFLISGAGNIGLAATSLMARKGDSEQLRRAWRFRLKSAILLMVPSMVLAAVVAPTLVTTLLSETYWPAVVVLRVALAGQIVNALLGGGAHADVLLALGHHRTVRTLRIGAGVANVALNLLLIPRWGAAGAAAATAVSIVGLTLAELRAMNRHLPGPLPGRAAAAMLAASLAAGAAVGWIPFAGWAYLAAAGVGFAAMFGILGALLKPYDAEDAHVLRRAGYPLDRLARFLCTVS